MLTDSVPVQIAELHGRVNAVEQAQGNHEDICAERYKGIRDDIGKLNRQIGWAAATLILTVLAVLGWSLKSQWDAERQTVEALISIQQSAGAKAPAYLPPARH